MRGDRTRDQSIKSRTLYQTELARLDSSYHSPVFCFPKTRLQSFHSGVIFLNRILGRVVKALDLSPSGLSPRGFEPRRMQIFEIQAQKFFFYRKTPAIFLKYNKLGWCSWLSRAPHTREVPSSILGSNIFFLSRKPA